MFLLALSVLGPGQTAMARASPAGYQSQAIRNPIPQAADGTGGACDVHVSSFQRDTGNLVFSLA